MNEREMLEFAAKAAGYGYQWPEEGRMFVSGIPGIGWKEWNPLTDDGDALRLAVKLRIHIEQNKDAMYGEYTMAKAIGIRWDNRPMEWWDNNESPEAATRRAIVRAAAEIGKAMP